MYKKVLKVTEDNLNYVATRFDIEDEEMIELIGFYLVADFGDDDGDRPSFLSKAALDKLFLPTDKELGNGFFEVIRK